MTEFKQTSTTYFITICTSSNHRGPIVTHDNYCDTTVKKLHGLGYMPVVRYSMTLDYIQL